MWVLKDSVLSFSSIYFTESLKDLVQYLRICIPFLDILKSYRHYFWYSTSEFINH